MLLTRANLRDVVLRGCRANLAGFAETRMADVRFESCDLRESDFQDARMTRVVFDRCDLTGADLRGARFDRCRMERCRLDGAALGHELKGLTLSYADLLDAVPALADALGLSIADRDEEEAPRARQPR
jgi:uncharacterized protein YjbI with pentapeptide repeats